MLELIFILKSTELFRGLPTATLARLAPFLQERSFKEGEVVFHQGEIGRKLYLISEGRVRVVSGGAEIAQVGPREVFGELAVLSPLPRSATVSAMEPTHAYTLDQDTFYELISADQNLAKSLIDTLIARYI